MKTHFLILAFACLFLQSEARLFGGSIGKWLGSNPSQDADDIAGTTTFSDPTASGDTAHARAGGPDTRKTADVIQTEISNGLRKDFGFIRESLTSFADNDGFVREGLVFCGGQEVVAAPGGSDYHATTGLLNMVDGYGNNITQADDKKACGTSECDEGSFVSLLANRIRALGYHVTHSDICIARASAALADDVVPTARTCKLQSNSVERKSYECTKTDYENGNDFFQINQKCYEAADSSACGLITDSGTSMCTYDTIEKLCQADNTYVQGKCNSGAANEKEGETIQPDGVEKNAVRRVISYSIKNPGEVPLTDKTYVMGTAADASGNNNCKSLRQYVAALNGMAQINAFRDTNIQEADDNWYETIKEARTFVAAYAEILDNFYDKSLLIFPPIEFEEFQDCPAGDVRKTSKNDGTKAAPLCDNTDYATRDTYNEMSANSQALLRAQCFCRKGSLPQVQSAVTPANKYEADDFYLSIQDKGGRANCSDFENLASVHQFCEHGNMESQRWRSALEALEPHESSIKVFGTAAQKAARRAKIYNNLLQTLPLVSSGYTPNCGRLVSSDGAQMMYSNKGGNCVPFAGMGDLLYRLEFETSEAEIGTARGAQTGGALAGTFGTRLCQSSDKLANTMYSFRQFAYLWDQARKAQASDVSVSVPSASTLFTAFPNDVNTQKTLAPSLTNQLFYHGATPMCNIDWTEELTGQTIRKDSAGSSYDNPYLLFDREVEEAIFNAGVAVQAKRQNAADNENLWAAVEAELTSIDTDRLNYDIAYEAAEHFMRIVTTDVNDPNVDSVTDAHATDADTEAPTPLDVCKLDEKASGPKACASCGGQRVVAVVSTTLYNAGTPAQKELQRFQARSSPSKDWDAVTSADTNAQACDACPNDNEQIVSGVCTACPGVTTQTAYTSGGCRLNVCTNANEYLDDAVSGSGSFNCTACLGQSTAPGGGHGSQASACTDPTCGVNEYLDNHQCDACPGVTKAAANSTGAGSCTGTTASCPTAGEYFDGSDNSCKQCPGDSTSPGGSLSAAACHGSNVCSGNFYFEATTNNCTACDGDKIGNATSDQVGVSTCLGEGACLGGKNYMEDGTGAGVVNDCTACPGDSITAPGKVGVSNCHGNNVCTGNDYFLASTNNCAACSGNSLVKATGSVGTQASACTGVNACAAQNSEYYDSSDFTCKACPGDLESRNNSVFDLVSCLGDYCLVNQYMQTTAGDANYQNCTACPGDSAADAGSKGYVCDANVSTYTVFAAAGLVTQINAAATGQNFGSATGAGQADTVYHQQNKVCRAFTSLKATCGTGHSSKDGTVVDIELATVSQNECGASKSFDITNTAKVKFGSTVFGTADDCLAIPDVTTNNNQDAPSNASGLVNVADAVVGNAIAPVHSVLSGLSVINTAATNILTPGSGSYFKLLSLTKDTTAASTSAYVIATTRHPTDEVGNGADDAKFADWKTDSGAYTQAVSNYNTALANYQDDLNALVDALNLMKADFEDARDKSAGAAAAAAAVTNAGNERDNFEADIVNLNTDYTAIKGRTGPNGGTALTGYATDGSSDGHTNVIAKAYRAELFVAAKGAEDYAAANVDIVTKANEFGKCTNAGSLLSSGTLTLAANALGGDCNSTTQTAIEDALEDLGLTGTAWNSSAANVWGQFDSSKTAAVVAAKYADVQSAISTINAGVAADKYHAAAMTDAAANGGSLSAQGTVADVTDSSNAAANALRTYLDGKTNSAWA